MPKALFFALPSVSVNNTLASVLERVALSGTEVFYYNAADFRPSGSHSFTFQPYPDYFDGYYSDKIGESTSYFEFAEILVDSAANLWDYLRSQVESKQPDFIVHSHLAVWGRLVAQYYNLPSVTLNTTFFLDKRIMLPYFKKTGGEQGFSFNAVNTAMRLHRKCDALYSRLGVKEVPDLYDCYVNKGDLNIAFILPQFQDKKHLFGAEYKFLGYPLEVKARRKKKLVYVSMGTIVNGDQAFYDLCIQVLAALKLPAIVSVGTKIDIQKLPLPQEGVQVVQYADQISVLDETTIFITRGGMASVHESLYSHTPMIVLPVIPEQQLTAMRIQELGVGINLASGVDFHGLCSAIREMTANYEGYLEAIDRLLNRVPHASTALAADLISDFIAERALRSVHVQQ